MTSDPGNVQLETPDIAAENRAALAASFPGVLADGVLDAAKLGELLDVPVANVTDGRERYGLMWAGKTEAVRSLLTPSHGTLVPDVENSVNFDTADNIFIEGDNLEVLKLMQKAYNDKIGLIYIDPPYNTGNDFVYDDDFSDGLRGYLEYTGQLDDEGNRRSTNTDVGGRRHSRWLSMMYPRLVLARNLLAQDGLLAVSIDDNEAMNLRAVLDEIFGQENFLNTFVWVSNLKGRQITGSGAAGTKEYIHVYARDAGQADAFRASASLLKTLMPSVYKGFDYGVKEDNHGPYVIKNELYNTNSAFNETTRPNLVFDIYYDPVTGSVKTEAISSDHVHAGWEKIPPHRNNNGTHRYHAFRWSRAKVESESYNLEFVKGPNGYRVYTKVRDVDSTAVKDLVMDLSTNDGARDIASLGLDAEIFDYPKPVRLVQLLCAFGSKPDSIVLDFFAGSGTTAHAVSLQNAADGGSRRCVSVNIPEPTAAGSGARKAGLDTVSDITWTRIRGVIEKIDGAAAQGLRTFTLNESNFRQGTVVDGQLELSETTLVSGIEVDSIAAEVLLKEGVSLDATWARHSVGGAEAVEANGVLVVLSTNLTDHTVEGALALSPRVVVFLEDGFAHADAVKANAFTNARNRGVTMKTV